MRVQGDPAQAVSMFRNVVRSLDPNVGVFDTMPMTEYVSASLFAQKVAALLLGVLGTISLVLAAIGLYSVMAYSVTQRTQEIGIRMALGARAVDVLAMVLRQGMGLTLGGLVVGPGGGTGSHAARVEDAGECQRYRSRDFRGRDPVPGRGGGPGQRHSGTPRHPHRPE